MRVCLQHIRTQLYLKEPGKWTADPGEALDFQNSGRALDFAREHNLLGAQTAVRALGVGTDDLTPLPPRFPDADHRRAA